MKDIREEYLELSKKDNSYLSIGVLLSSLVFVIPFLIIIFNGWWEPLGSSELGWRWVVVSTILLLLVYGSLLFDRLYRKH